jgi:putative transposase
MRRPRNTQEGAKYHVTARANHQKLLMDHDTVKQMFLDVLARAHEKFDFRIDNFVLMGNHFHLILQPLGKSTLAAIMKWILQTFAIRYNKANGLWGHFWGGRFFSWIIPTLSEFLRVFAYIDANPVRAGLVPRAEEWKWGGLWFRRTGPPKWLSVLPRLAKQEEQLHGVDAAEPEVPGAHDQAQTCGGGAFQGALERSPQEDTRWTGG